MTKARYLRLADMLAGAIKDGKLAPGQKLPTHRAFAEQCHVALATATRVYQELARRGLITGEAGRGTFVRDLGVPLTLGVHQTASDGLIDLVFNMPGEAADAEMLRKGLRRLSAAGDLDAMLRYQPHAGRLHERRIIADSLAPRLGPVDPEQLLVTSGGQHGLALLALGLFQRGDAIATDALTYPGFKSVAALQGLGLVPVQGPRGMMDADDLEKQCRAHKLSAVYLMPTVHNPLGGVIDLPTRRRIVEIARKFDLQIIEDAAYAFLEPNPPPSFVTLAPERTIYVGSYSKCLATGLRLGFLIAPKPCQIRLQEAIRATTWNAPALISGLVTGWIQDGTLQNREQARRQDGAARQHLCQQILGPASVVSHPNAGFAWVPLHKGSRADPLIARLKEQGISVSGAAAFATTVAIPQALRLAFGGVPSDALEQVFQTVYDTIGNARVA
ncbi:PLP-dependent aminotransferase family protein [Cognatishimia sp. WU-CL00825]|uniref:aminotransferase-like domain-containing protein n=1 Tax=Cognatishimia sp. WU-CL00825 TaxID=3127658 RepID=UPI003108D47D